MRSVAGSQFGMAECTSDSAPQALANFGSRASAARNFWSVFAYDASTRTFIANSMKGRHLSSLDKLVKNSDGSTDIYFGPTAPKGLEANWIESIPGSENFIGLRTYGPEKALLDGTYKIPRFELVK